MNVLKVEELISNYWNCETSEEEEVLLRDFFLQEEVPAHLAKYKSLFVYQKQQTGICVSEDFEQKILEQIENEQSVVRLRKKRVFINFIRVAAVVLLMFSIGGVTAYLLNDREEYQFNYTDTFSSPDEAYSVIQSAVYAVSANLNEGQQESVKALSGLGAFFEYMKLGEPVITK